MPAVKLPACSVDRELEPGHSADAERDLLLAILMKILCLIFRSCNFLMMDLLRVNHLLLVKEALVEE